MPDKMKWLYGVLALLLVLNIVNWAGGFGKKRYRAAPAEIVRSVSISYRSLPEKPGKRPAGEIFNGPASFAPEPAAVTQKTEPLPPPPVRWPDFRVAGTAVNDGKKCAFFSGSAFKGVINEGDDIVERYVLTSIGSGSVEITDKISGEKRTFKMEGR